ncbi:Na(+)-translocating NADH-quinone reductase subunit C [Myxococcota bacterium]|nr:Na(+)-translocating NADH-quinone reductase subunit C [Myxococcota bacterium]
MQHSSRYIVLFALAVCGVCSIFVAVSAVSLKERQERNKAIDVQSKVLVLAGLMSEGERLSGEEIGARFSQSIESKVVRLATGEYDETIDADRFDQRSAAADLSTSREAPPNLAKVRRTPHHAVVYHVRDESGSFKSLILPIQGQGLWSTLYGFIALAPDANGIQGITFYEHGETPGLGGEVDNPRWKSLWIGRKAFGESGEVEIEVKKGTAGKPEDDPYRVDGLSGATITSRGVTGTLKFWLGEYGFGSYLNQFRAERGI